jgi:hypothetical protein
LPSFCTNELDFLFFKSSIALVCAAATAANPALFIGALALLAALARLKLQL